MRYNVVDYLRNQTRHAKNLAEKSVYDENGSKHPKRQFWQTIERNLDEFTSEPRDAETSIILLPGPRGLGKTFAILQLLELLVNEKRTPFENVLYVSMDDVKQSIDISIKDVAETFIEKMHDQELPNVKKKLFILIDEAHFDEKWDTSLKIIFDKSPSNVFIVAAGSSTISTQSSPDLARRSYKEKALPLNFSEYLTMKHEIHPTENIASAIKKTIFDPSESNVHELNSLESDNMNKISRTVNAKNALRNFVFYGGFANGIKLKNFELYRKLNGIVDKTITKDLSKIHNFTLESQSDIKKLIFFLSVQTTGKFSRENISKELGIPVKKVEQILNALEKSHLIFPLKPGSSGNKRAVKPWKYYFTSPTMNAALHDKIRPVNKWDDQIYGKLIENLVASCLFRMYDNEELQKAFYDSNDGSADFIIETWRAHAYHAQTTLKQINLKTSRLKQNKKPQTKLLQIPIEASINKKSIEQVKKSLKTFKNSEHGILITNREKTEMKNRILYMPLTTFALL